MMNTRSGLRLILARCGVCGHDTPRLYALPGECLECEARELAKSGEPWTRQDWLITTMTVRIK